MRIKRETILTLIVFAFIASLLIIFEIHPNLPDSDSFYHAKMAATIRDQGFIKTFPWFQWTDLKNTYVNPHLLYHILLIPFVTLFNPLIGIKISAAVFGLLAFLAIYLTARALKAPHPWIFPLLAAFSQGFLFRMSLPRAPSLSITILLLATWAMLEKRAKILFLISFFFVWLYHGWPVIFLSLGALFVATFIAEAINSPSSYWKIFKKTLGEQKENLVATTIGTLAGLIINPYFPQNIKFFFLDVYKIGIINYQAILPVGQEWLPISASDFLVTFLPPLLAVGFCLAFFLPDFLKKKNRPETKQMTIILTFLFLASGYTLLCFKGNRYKEYAVPFMILTAAVLFPFALAFWNREIWPGLQKVLKKSRGQKIFFGGMTATIIVGLIFGSIKIESRDDEYYQAKQYETATDWIKIHVPKGENIFHSSWDYASILWYLDDTHNYLTGLDPTFMYDYNSVDYDLWSRLVNSQEKDVSKINSVFKSRTVIIEKRLVTASTFIENLTASGLFIKVAENEWVEVYADPTL